MRTSRAVLFILLFVLIFGCDSDVPVAPEVDRTNHPGSIITGIDNNHAKIVQNTSIVPLAAGLTERDIHGRAWLTRTSEGIWLETRAVGNEINSMESFTYWGALFNNPDACEGPCDFPDLFNEAVGGMLMNFGGAVTNEGGVLLGGKNAINPSHWDKMSTAGLQVLINPFDLNGIQDPLSAEIHIIIRNHGSKEMSQSDLNNQTSMVGAFCNLAIERDTDGNPDGCADQGLAVFLPPGKNNDGH